MNTIRDQVRSKYLLQIKRIVDADNNGDKLIIVRTEKNINFIREYGLDDEDVKNIIRSLSVEDCFCGPEPDRNPKFDGPVFKFSPMFEDVKLYVKIRVESTDKSHCMSVHEFGLYDEVE